MVIPGTRGRETESPGRKYAHRVKFWITRPIRWSRVGHESTWSVNHNHQEDHHDGDYQSSIAKQWSFLVSNESFKTGHSTSMEGGAAKPHRSNRVVTTKK